MREVAARLRVSPATVYGWLKGGVLPACKIGGTWRVHRRELEIRINGNSGGGLMA
ncbi:MAG: helix-turn-helix domain-containing protein [Chloroflexi bacterium]|nr:helix-turn-helix domain-containing protein [Chloroflexota bacterium]